MSENINRSDVTASLRDVFGQPITDDVEITFFNQKAHSLSQKFTVKFRGKPETLPGVPAFPFGLAEVLIKPKKYRFKSIFLNVVGGEQNSINEDFFVDPDKARPTLIDFQDLPSKIYGTDLLRILKNSGINQAAWNALDKRNRASILNLSAKMLQETIKNGQTIISQVESINKTLLDKKNRARVYAGVQEGLLNALRKFPEKFNKVSGALHDFPDGSTPVNQDNSFKSREKGGNIQLTFATNAAGGSVSDIDLDDHAGIKHASDVLKHKITGKDTDPYDIHEILMFFQHIDPGYRLV
jgi:hypothetical protein